MVDPCEEQEVRVGSRARRLWLPGLVLALLFGTPAGCGAGPTAATKGDPSPAVAPQPQPRDTRPRLQLRSTPEAAEVVVDGVPRGTAAAIAGQGGLPLDPGLHRLEVRHPGYRPYRLEFILKDEGESLDLRLIPRDAPVEPAEGTER